MTAKDFRLIAETIRHLPLPTEVIRWDVAQAFATRLALVNDRFQRDRFLVAATGSASAPGPALTDSELAADLDDLAERIYRDRPRPWGTPGDRPPPLLSRNPSTSLARGAE